MVVQYVSQGLFILLNCLGLGLVVYGVTFGILKIITKRSQPKPIQLIFEFILVSYVLAILEITGIIGMQFYIKEVFEGYYNMNLIPFKDVSIMMLMLNYCLFIPYGFLLTIVFDPLKHQGKLVLVIGFMTSLMIETLQIFGGRFAEIDDVIANTLGTYTGFLIFAALMKLFSQMKYNKASK